MNDIDIANQVDMLPISVVTESFGIEHLDLENYGNYKAKISNFEEFADIKSKSKLVLVSAINPTKAGEGKTTVTLGLNDALNKIGSPSVAAIREPSLGPVFGIKGGAAGGGYSQVVPMEDINLHFTGDFHAITSANNLLCALLDNHIKQGNALGIDPTSITFKRVIDMNDRQLRFVVDGLQGPNTAKSTLNGVPREDGFDITVASEVMAIFCLATSLEDLKYRLGQIVVAKTYSGENVTAEELKANGAMTVLLKDAIKPNIVQSLEHNPVLIHGGPFANIAHGCNSVIATKTALGITDQVTGAHITGEQTDGASEKNGYVVTEAGFGADLGMEKFLDIKCRKAGIFPDCVVVVATIRALKAHGGVADTDFGTPNVNAVKDGLPNLIRHLENIKNVYKIPRVVALNYFPTDTDEEIQTVIDACEKLNVNVIVTKNHSLGGEGAIDLANEVVKLTSIANPVPTFAYGLDQPIADKIEKIASRIYGADGVTFVPSVKKQIAELEDKGYQNLPICVAKTQYSFSDNQSLLGAPSGFKINITNVKLSAGAGFIVALSGSVMTMPGLPKVPAANSIDIIDNQVVGLF
jgi:formate--tetrahydrofolate ligase